MPDRELDRRVVDLWLREVREDLATALHCHNEGSLTPENSAIEALINAVGRLERAVNILAVAQQQAAQRGEEADG